MSAADFDLLQSYELSGADAAAIKEALQEDVLVWNKAQTNGHQPSAREVLFSHRVNRILKLIAVLLFNRVILLLLLDKRCLCSVDTKLVKYYPIAFISFLRTSFTPRVFVYSC
jgi:hypothetical protein